MTTISVARWMAAFLGVAVEYDKGALLLLCRFLLLSHLRLVVACPASF